MREAAASSEIALLPPDIRVQRGIKERARRESVERDKVECPASLRTFVQRAWHIIEPGTTYHHNWHIDAICEHLEALVRGDIRNLLITMPPRHMKSICSSVMLPTWLWTFKPHYKFLFSSYAHSLSIRDALKSRRLIQSGWYQDRWGEIFTLTGDQNAKMRYENDCSGYRIATSVGGTATGEGGDLIAVDDAHNMKEIHSDIIREGVIDWWKEVMSTRLNDPKRGSKLIIMQRGHELDLAGYVLKRKGVWEHLNLPAEYEGSKVVTSLGWRDPRTKKGELLWPERFGETELRLLKEELGVYGTAGQLQQRPAPEEGGIFKRPWFKLWARGEKMPKFTYIVQSYDTAFTEKTMSDDSACLVLAVFEHPRLKYNCVMLADAWNEKLDYTDLRKRVRTDLNAKYGEKENARRGDVVLVEQKGSGITLLQDLRLLGVPAYGYNPEKSDKITRAHAAAPFIQAGRMYVLESNVDQGEPVSWARPFMHEVLTFPNAASDNYVDALSQAIILLRNHEIIQARVGNFEEDDPSKVVHEEKYVNPYAV